MSESQEKVMKQTKKAIIDYLMVNDRIVIVKPRKVYIVLNNKQEAKSVWSHKKINIKQYEDMIIAIIRSNEIIYVDSELVKRY